MKKHNLAAVSAVLVPQEARDAGAAQTRTAVIHDHGFWVDVDWWNPKLIDRGLPGSPLSTADGATAGHGWIDRKHLFSLADAAFEDEIGESALRLLWAVLSWGSGYKNRLNRQRIAAVAADPQTVALRLRDAARLSRTDPDSAFSWLRNRDTRIPYLGPGYFTKYLYFAGGGRLEHSSFIIDSRVLTTLAPSFIDLPQTPRKRFSYGLPTFRIASGLLQSWAAELSTSERPVAADEIERWAFGR